MHSGMRQKAQPPEHKIPSAQNETEMIGIVERGNATMNLRQLEYFIVATQCKNMTEAATRLHMAQPPLSRAIKMLEDELGTPLFHRSNKGIQLTEAGQLLYHRATQLLRNVEDIQTDVREMSSELCGNIKIGACYSTLSIVTKKMEYFLQQHSTCTFSIVQGTIESLEADLHNGAVDFLFLRNCAVNSDKFTHITLPLDPLYFVIHQELDTDPDNETPDVMYLQGIPICTLDEHRFSGYGAQLLSECERYGFAPKIICTCYDNSVALALALNKVAATFLPASAVESNHYPDLHVKRIQGLDLSSYPTLIYNPKTYHTRSVQAFLDLFLDEN